MGAIKIPINLPFCAEDRSFLGQSGNWRDSFFGYDYPESSRLNFIRTTGTLVCSVIKRRKLIMRAASKTYGKLKPCNRGISVHGAQLQPRAERTCLKVSGLL